MTAGSTSYSRDAFGRLDAVRTCPLFQGVGIEEIFAADAYERDPALLDPLPNGAGLLMKEIRSLLGAPEFVDWFDFWFWHRHHGPAGPVLLYTGTDLIPTVSF